MNITQSLPQAERRRVPFAQRRRRLGELLLRIGLLTVQSPHERRIDDVAGRTATAAGLTGCAELIETGFDSRPRCLRICELGTHVRHLLKEQGLAARCGEQAGLRAKLLDRFFGVLHLRLELQNLVVKPARRSLDRLQAQFELIVDVTIDQRVGDLHRQTRV